MPSLPAFGLMIDHIFLRAEVSLLVARGQRLHSPSRPGGSGGSCAALHLPGALAGRVLPRMRDHPCRASRGAWSLWGLPAQTGHARAFVCTPVRGAIDVSAPRSRLNRFD
jgi:hypothetical protein